MAGGGRSISQQWASSAALGLQLASVLLGLLATLCWFWASVSPVEVQAVGEGVDLRWWSASVAVPGIGVGLLVWFAGTVRGRIGLLIIFSLLVLVVAGAVWFIGGVAPTASPIHPVGSAVPFAVAGFTAAAAACLLTVLSVAMSGGWSAASRPAGPAMGPRTVVLAALAALLLVVGAGLLIVDRSQDYLLRVNEYRSLGDVDGSPAAAPVSSLAGGTRWEIEVPGLSLAKPAATRYGIGMASGQNAIMVDAATGEIRWRYTRSDVTGSVSVASTGDGEQVLAWWGPDAVYVLDARTGARVGHWETTGTQLSILDPALPVISRTEPDGRTTLARLSLRGRDLWTYPLGSCERARATGSEATLVVTVVTVCEARSNRIVGLDAETGREVWTTTTEGEVRAIAGGTAVVVNAPGEDRPTGSLTAVDLRDGTARWIRDLPRHENRALPCADSWVDATRRLVALACNWDLTDYATVGEQQASAVFTYDLESGSLRQTHRYAAAPITATTVFADGRVLVALIDEQQRWVVEVRSPQGERHRASIAPYAGSHMTVRDLAVVSDQVLVIDGGAERLGCLR